MMKRRADAGPIRCAIYARVSTKTQQDQGTSLTTQLERCRAFATEKGWRIEAEFQEAHTARELWQRPKLTALRDMVKRHEVDVVLVYERDRLSRADDEGHFDYLRVEFRQHGVGIESATERQDVDPVSAMIERKVDEILATVENVKRRERSMRGIRARVEGKQSDGTPKLIVGRNALLGYQWRDLPKKSAYDVDETTAPIVRRIFAECIAGKPLLTIAADLTADGIYPPRAEHTGNTVWAARTLQGILTHPAYKGEAWAYATIVVKDERTGRNMQRKRDVDDRVLLPEGTIPPIVSPELWQAAQDRLQRNKVETTRNGRIANASALLRAGFVFCGVCGWRMYVSRTTKGLTRYQCQSKSHTSKYDCKYHSINAEMLDETVWSRVIGTLTNREHLRRELERLRANDPTGDDLATIDRTLADLRRQASKVETGIRTAESTASIALLTGTLDKIMTSIEGLQRDRAKIAKQHDEWEAGLRLLSEDDYASDKLAELWRMGREGDTDAMRDRLAALGVKVSVYPPKWDGPRWKIEARVPLAADGLYSVWWNVRDETAADWLGRPDAFTRRADAELRGSA